MFSKVRRKVRATTRNVRVSRASKQSSSLKKRPKRLDVSADIEDERTCTRVKEQNKIISVVVFQKAFNSNFFFILVSIIRGGFFFVSRRFARVRVRVRVRG